MVEAPTKDGQQKTDHTEGSMELQHPLQRQKSDSMDDDLSVSRQIAIETQLRQLEELQSLTEETTELKLALGTQHSQQQQQKHPEERRHGK